ncbi:MAG: TIGR03619 family F420-dependent LLM class oxidoreductase [Spirochaetaceae bacterium]|nr:TIGR03619 family F420-dependent LLM class oxidoreductase [Spirochaetaceae bacterium]
MLIGFAVPLSGSWATPDNQVKLAQRAEELGYASLWTFQRLLYPADPGASETPERWSPVYRSVHDPIVALAYLAAHTSRIRLGVAVINMPWFSPLLLAKQAATLDAVSGGRLDLGLGLGWAREEYDAAGAPFERRGARAEEFITALKAIWTQDVVSFDGEFHSIRSAVVEPKPVQRPHPPLLLGGSADAALRRAGRLCDGWVSSSGQDLTSIGRAIEVVAEGARRAGRDPATLRHVCRGALRVRPGQRSSPRRRPLTGSYDEIRADLAVLADQGVTEVFLDLNFDPEVGTMDADAATSMRRGHEVLEALADLT